MRRQTGICATSGCYQSILSDSVDHVCDAANNPVGCTQTYALTANNVLTADSGILYLTLEFDFNSDSSYVELGGVRLTLEHD